MSYHCDTCTCDDYEPPKPPSTSTPQAREAAKRAARDAVLAAKERGGR